MMYPDMQLPPPTPTDRHKPQKANRKPLSWTKYISPIIAVVKTSNGLMPMAPKMRLASKLL